MTAVIDPEKVIDILVDEVGWGRDSFAATKVRKSLEGVKLEDLEAKSWRLEALGSSRAIVWGPSMSKGTSDDPRIAIYYNNHSSTPAAAAQAKRLAEHLNATGFKP